MKIDFDQDKILKGWQRFIQGGELIYSIPAPIARSWLRCQSKKLPAVKLLPERLALLAENTTETPHQFLNSFRENIYPIFEQVNEKDLLLTLVDARGPLLDWKGNKDFLLTGDLHLNTNFQEESLGTMAVGLALKEKKTHLTRGAEHYYSCYHGLANYAVPLIIDNGFIGVLSGWSALEYSDFMAAIVSLGQKLLLTGEFVNTEKGEH